MGLVVVAIFDEVYEGEVAASLLRSAGIPTFLLGEQLAKFYPFKQRAWGGVRLAVPANEYEDAKAILAAARAGAFVTEPPAEATSAARRSGWVVASIAAMLLGSAEAGWAVEGLRRRRTPLMWAGVLLLTACIALFIWSGWTLWSLTY